jgi:hypothetical protein
VPLVAALLKKKAQAAPNPKLICRCLSSAASSGIRPASCGLCSGLTFASPLLDGPHPCRCVALLLISLCLISPPLLAAVIGFSNLRLDPCWWAALGSPPRTHASLLAQRSFLECTLSRGGAAGSSTAGGEDDGFGLQENRNKQCQIPSLKFFDQLRAAAETC